MVFGPGLGGGLSAFGLNLPWGRRRPLRRSGVCSGGALLTRQNAISRFGLNVPVLVDGCIAFASAALVVAYLPEVRGGGRAARLPPLRVCVCACVCVCVESAYARPSVRRHPVFKVWARPAWKTTA